jgi:hypothetical protein
MEVEQEGRGGDAETDVGTQINVIVFMPIREVGPYWHLFSLNSQMLSSIILKLLILNFTQIRK